MSLNRSGLIWPGGWSLPGPVTNVEFGKGSHANWILVPRVHSLLRCNFDWTWMGEGGGRGEGGGSDDKGSRSESRASTKRNDVNGWFICRDDEIARRYILSEGDNVCASSSVKSCGGSWTIVYTISPLLSYSLGSDVSSSVKSPMTSFRDIEKN